MDDQPSPQPAVLKGYVDEAGPAYVAGWAWAPDQPAEIVFVELVGPTGEVAARGQASRFRADLEAAGKRGGRCAFKLVLPSEAAGPFTLRAVLLSEDGEALILADGVPGRTPEPQSSAFPFRFVDGIKGYLDGADERAINGWCHTDRPFGEPVTLQLIEDGQVLATARANRWRNDLAETRQGDGRCGFEFVPPSCLYDGQEHRLDLQLADERILTPRPVTVWFPATQLTSAEVVAPGRPPEGAPIVLSIIVNFYNMEREAARTLHSLSRRFQRGMEHIGYEVLCVDNGSSPALEETFVTSFGPEFRLVRPQIVRPSPCAALNEAATQARGRWLALMIDGAHLLSPGALCEAHAALAGAPRAVVALRQWFIGGDQRWFSSVGYSRDHEDILFCKISWPEEGYRLFEISSPMYESPNSWFDGMSESNCLFVATDLYAKIGGFDEAFDRPGAGFANLDLFRRAVDAADVVISLVGEASFHQYHGGITTNIDDLVKDRRVRTYANHYEQVRGESFANVPPEQIRVAGSIHVSAALVARQRPYCPVGLGLTPHIRPRSQAVQFDAQAQRYLQAAYVETGRHLTTRWAGLQVGVAPSDLTDIQEAIWRVQPECVVLKNTSPGLTRFVASLLPTLDLEQTQVFWVTSGFERLDDIGSVDCIIDDTDGRRPPIRMEKAIGAAERVLVLFQPAAQDTLPAESLEAYARVVSFGSYLVVIGAAFGQPWLGYSQSWLYAAIRRFIRQRSDFVIDRTMNQHFITTCPSGFLRRVLDPMLVQDYDASLDDLAGL